MTLKLHEIALGDIVRDKAHLGGQVIAISGGRALVQWNNGRTGWIDVESLTKEPG